MMLPMVKAVLQSWAEISKAGLNKGYRDEKGPADFSRRQGSYSPL